MWGGGEEERKRGQELEKRRGCNERKLIFLLQMINLE